MTSSSSISISRNFLKIKAGRIARLYQEQTRNCKPQFVVVEIHILIIGIAFKVVGIGGEDRRNFIQIEGTYVPKAR